MAGFLRGIVLAGALAGALAAAADGPDPVDGITFDEWISANARLAAGRTMDQILATLHVTRPQWDEANAAFGKALSSGPAGGPLIDRYGRVFASPDAGRFHDAGDAPKAREFASFETFARAQAEMSAAQEAGIDPSDVLQKQFGMTVYDYSQAERPWVAAIADAAAHDPARLRRWEQEQAAFEAQARERYQVGGPKRSDD